MSSATNRQNIIQLIRNRELNDHIRTKYALKSNLDYKCISKLGLHAQLEGHRQRVGCLQWNESGSTLASGSQDNRVILWDPFLQKVKTTIKSLQNSFISSVKFIPGCNDDIIVTGIGDWSLHTYNVTTGKKLSSCICARGYIGSLAVANDSPSLYWSASNDGCISQHDIRMSHECPSDKSKTTLVELYGRSGEIIGANCLDINQLRTEQLAVSAHDQYVRLYDRRMIQSLSSFFVKHTSEHASVNDLNNVKNALQYFVPGHMHSIDSETKTQQNYVITYLTFSPDGQELLVNYCCECVYLYNLVNQADNAFFNIPKVMKFPRENNEGSSTDLIDDQVPVPHLTLPDNVLVLKEKAYSLFKKEDYTAAIDIYNEAINIHKCSDLLLNRATAYIKRKCQGDIYAALRDCITALKLEPDHMEAHFQLAVSLFKLDKLKDSKMYLDKFTMKYPSYQTRAAYKSLYSDLLNAQSKNVDTFDGKKFFERSRISSNIKINFRRWSQPQKIPIENFFCNQAKDYNNRYFRNCNVRIYNQEANFFGSRSQFIVASTENGSIIVWEKNTENQLLKLKGDKFNVSCIQPHPSEFLLATSGCDNIVKLWSPLSDAKDDVDNTIIINDYSRSAVLNQRKL